MKTETKAIRTIKPDETNRAYLIALSRKLKAANRMLSAGKKLADNSKASLAKWLKENRDIDIESLPIGELLIVDGILLFEVGTQNRFDEAGFSALHGSLYESFKRDFPVRKFKPLV